MESEARLRPAEIGLWRGTDLSRKGQPDSKCNQDRSNSRVDLGFCLLIAFLDWSHGEHDCQPAMPPCGKNCQQDYGCRINPDWCMVRQHDDEDTAEEYGGFRVGDAGEIAASQCGPTSVRLGRKRPGRRWRATRSKNHAQSNPHKVSRTRELDSGSQPNELSQQSKPQHRDHRPSQGSTGYAEAGQNSSPAGHGDRGGGDDNPDRARTKAGQKKDACHAR